MSVRLFRMSYFVWLVVPIALWFTYMNIGVPNMIWSYSFADEGQGYDPFANREYTRCTYIGASGEITLHPTNGKCSFLHFFKMNER